jgi:hypothetical protein
VLAGSEAIQASVVNAARVAPGGPGAAGALTLTGAHTQTATGALAIELGGTEAGQFDVLAVSGRATLAGRLAASAINNFAPQVGDQFRVLTHGSRVGEFGQLDPAFVPSVGVRVQYNARDATVVIEAP